LTGKACALLAADEGVRFCSGAAWPPGQAAYRIARPSFTVSDVLVTFECVPDPDILDCGNIFVSVAADGCMLRAALDTGSPTTVLIDVPQSARPVGRQETSGMFGAEVVMELGVGELRIGSLSVGPIVVHRIAAGVGRHPVVGLDLLSTGPWQLDPSNGTLLTGAPLSRGSTFARAANGHILTKMRWAGAAATAMWDTGAGITLFDRQFAAAHPNLFEEVGTAVGTDVTGSQGEFLLARVCGYEIDGTSFEGHVVAIADLPDLPDHIDAAIGFPTIKQARWAVDMQACRWSIDIAPNPRNGNALSSA
jgi:hypothetical protein